MHSQSTGYGRFHIQNIIPKQYGFRKYFILQGVFKKYHTPHQTFHHIFASFSSKKYPEFFEGKDLWIHGTLQKKDPFKGKFFLKKNTPIQTLGTYNHLEGFRYKIKNKIQKYLRKNLSHSHVSSFFDATLLGIPSNKRVQFAFANVGLQHLLVISGFHFSFLCGLCFFLFRKIFSLRITLILSFIFLSAYFLLIGSAPSIERAWIIASLYLWSKWLGKPTSPINLLGVSLIWEGLFHPIYLTYLGFYLSYLACLGILLFYHPIEQKLIKWLPKRTAEEQKELNIFEKTISSFLAFFRGSFSLTLSVSIILIPFLFCFFQKFCPLSFFYNLLIPPLVFICFSLLFISLLIPPIFIICDLFTLALLNILFTVPPEWNYKIIISPFSFSWVFLYLFFLFYTGICIKKSLSV